jgi:glycosyltransferase involved in cell wall biosynthesis
VLEGMATGTPVVACDVGSVRDMVLHGETGLVVAPRDTAALAHALGEMLRLPKRSREMGEASRRRSLEEFDMTQLVSKSLATFDQVTSERRPQRTAVIAPYYSPRIGGVENYARQVAMALRDSPLFDPVVITTNSSRRDVVQTLDGIQVIRLGIWGRVSNSPVNPAWLWRLPRLLRQLDVDVISAHAPTPFLADIAAFARRRPPLQLVYHSGSMAKGGPTDLLVRGYERAILPALFRRADDLVSVSPAGLAAQMAEAPIVSPGVDTVLFTPNVAISRETATVLYVGRVESSSRWKGLDVLVKALAEIQLLVPSVRLIIAGWGDDVPRIQSLAASLGVADLIEWAGLVEHSELPAFYQRATVTVLPSLTAAESFGMTIVEAMACGCPVVGSDVGGVSYVLRDQIDGLLVPPGDPDALAEAITKIIEDPELGQHMSDAGVAASKARWRWDLKTEALLARLGRLTHGPPE